MLELITKILERSGYKIVKYRGRRYLLRTCYKFIATDMNGEIYCYVKRPWCDVMFDMWEGNETGFVSHGKSIDINWQESLEEI